MGDGGRGLGDGGWGMSAAVQLYGPQQVMVPSVTPVRPGFNGTKLEVDDGAQK